MSQLVEFKAVYPVLQNLDEKKDMLPFFVTLPHSGEKVPDECFWLKNLDEKVLMCDVDRFVDLLYQDSLRKLNIPFHKTEWHRYAVDLNRIPSDIDCESVIGSLNPAGKYNRGYHWVVTTHNAKLMQSPIDQNLHEKLTELIYTPFHQGVKELYAFFENAQFKNIYHLDLHSMPSVGTAMHRDPGEHRADIVISDSMGKSCTASFRDLVIVAFATAGFKVGYNWPYFGGRLTEHYGEPQKGHHVIQVELNRSLYMNEETKKIKPEHVEIQQKLMKALEAIKTQLPNLKFAE